MTMKESDIEILQQQNEMATPSQPTPLNDNLANIVASDERVNFYTGIESRNILYGKNIL